jgi:transcriptional antiterminator NusG
MPDEPTTPSPEGQETAPLPGTDQTEAPTPHLTVETAAPPEPTPEFAPAAAEEQPPEDVSPPSPETVVDTPAVPDADEAAAEEKPAEEPAAPPAEPSKKRWYVVKVQSGREESIKEAIERRIKIEGLEEYFGQIVIPVEKVTEMRNGKKVTKTKKLFPGYLVAEVEYNDRILYLFRETSGVGDFVGAGVNRAPTPMTPREVERMIRKGGQEKEGAEIKEVHGKPPVDRGDRVKVKDGTFAGMEGEVKELIEARSLVRVELTIFGRGVPVELEFWQVEPV